MFTNKKTTTNCNNDSPNLIQSKVRLATRLVFFFVILFSIPNFTFAQMGVEKDVQLKWKPDPSAEYYKIEISDTPDFYSIIHSDKTYDTHIPVTLQSGEYFARVAGVVGNFAGEWSEPKQILVEIEKTDLALAIINLSKKMIKASLGEYPINFHNDSIIWAANADHSLQVLSSYEMPASWHIVDYKAFEPFEVYTINLKTGIESKRILQQDIDSTLSRLRIFYYELESEQKALELYQWFSANNPRNNEIYQKNNVVYEIRYLDPNDLRVVFDALEINSFQRLRLSKAIIPLYFDMISESEASNTELIEYRSLLGDGLLGKYQQVFQSIIGNVNCIVNYMIFDNNYQSRLALQKMKRRLDKENTAYFLWQNVLVEYETKVTE